MEGEEFLRRMAAGDAGVFDDLYPIMRKIALGACRDLRIFDQSRDDIVQDVCLKVFTHWHSYQGDSKLNTWIYSIARNRCLDDLRRLQVRKAVMSEPVAGTEDDSTVEPRAPADLVHKSRFNLEQRLCVQQVLDELDCEPVARKGSMRKIDVLRWWVENSPTSEEMAEFLKTTVTAAKERKSYILKHVRELCRKFCGQDECVMS